MTGTEFQLALAESRRERQRCLRDYLRKLTKGCNDEMHEPDCQDVRVVKTRGRTLDNAGFDSERAFLLRNDDSGEEAWFNLADVIALARKAVIR